MTEQSPTLQEALSAAELRKATQFRRPVYRDPWDSPIDMVLSYMAACVIVPALLYAGGQLMGSIFSLSARWPFGLFLLAALVGEATFITIVGRERGSAAVDLLTITGWLILGLVIAPIVALALSDGAAATVFAVLLVGNLIFVRAFGVWQEAFRRSLSWPVTWSVMALIFAAASYELIFFT